MARKYTKYSNEQVIQETKHFIETKNTCTGLAKELNMHQSTVWFHVNKRIKKLDAELYAEARKVSAIPWRDRAKM